LAITPVLLILISLLPSRARPGAHAVHVAEQAVALDATSA
jgi:hypothetical protein